MSSGLKHRGEPVDEVGALIRIADRPRAVPEYRIERARAAAHATWRRESRRSRARRLWNYGALAAAASLALVAGYRALPGPAGQGTGGAEPITLELKAGTVRLLGSAGEAASQSRLLEPIDAVAPDSALLTSGATRAALRLPSGHSLRLDHSTQVRLLDSRTLALDRGAIYVDSGKQSGAAQPLVVQTSFGRLEEAGTQFEVRLEGSSARVRVREGAIVLHHAEETRDVAVGTEIFFDSGGSISTRSIPADGSEWEWVAEITPMLDLEGRTAREFLDWAAREQGLRLSFDDDAVERAAAMIEVAGDIEGMTIDQALGAVLPSCQLAYRIEKGRLEVGAETRDAAAR